MAENTGTGDLKRSPWVMASGVILYVLFSWLGVHLMETLRLPDPPGSEQPWYFIRRDAIIGLCFVPYLVLCVVIGLIAIKKKIAGGVTLIWFSIVWSAAPVWTLFVIYLRSDHIFDPLKARTSWPTFDSYYGDPLRWVWLIPLFVGTIIHAVSRSSSRRFKRVESSGG